MWLAPSTVGDVARIRLLRTGGTAEHGVYGSLVSFAQQLGLGEVAALLEQTLNEEKAADAKLTQIGETSVNPLAVGEVRRAA